MAVNEQDIDWIREYLDDALDMAEVERSGPPRRRR